MKEVVFPEDTKPTRPGLYKVPADGRAGYSLRKPQSWWVIWTGEYWAMSSPSPFLALGYRSIMSAVQHREWIGLVEDES